MYRIHRLRGSLKAAALQGELLTAPRCYTEPVRGDSVRDLYAKTLALLGLGVLAGTGALVDYWPVGVSTPVVTTPFSQMPPPGPLAVDAVGVLPDRVDSAPAAIRPSPRVAHLAAPPAPAAPVRALMVVTAPANFPPGSTVELREPDLIPESLVALASEFVTAQDQDQNVSGLSIAAAVEPPAGAPRARLMPADSASTGLADDGDGPITGVFKKAGSSIVKTGAKTGASIFDTFRIVSGMVRRALPVN
jgi:hypothetical protein